MVYPVFYPRDYEVAMKVYNEKKSNLPTKENTAEENHEQKLNDTQAAVQGDAPTIAYNNMHKIGKRNFTIDKLGVYCSGRISDFPDDKFVYAKLFDAANMPLDVAHVYMADRSKNTLFHFGTTEKLYYRENTDYLFWVVTTKGEIGVLSPGSFAALVGKSETASFKMNLWDAVTGVDLLRFYLSS
jgi:hypothetical protein